MRVIKVDDLENQFVAVTTNRGRLLVFPISELPVLSKGKGLQNWLLMVGLIDLLVAHLALWHWVENWLLMNKNDLLNLRK
jgi:hypothetical protein